MTAPHARTAAVSLALLAALGLSACSGEESSTPGEDAAAALPDVATYDFEDQRVADPDEVPPYVVEDSPVVIKLSDELKEVVPDGHEMAVEQFLVTAKTFSTGMCRTDFEITYADGGFDALTELRQTARDRRAADAEEYLAEYLAEHGEYPYNDSEERDAELAGVPIDFDEAIPVWGLGNDVEVVSDPPADEDLEEETNYATEDGTHFTVVSNCERTLSVKFPSMTWTDELDEALELGNTPAPDSFASVEIGVSQGTSGGPDGTSLILEGYVEADVSVAGEWAPRDDL